MQNFNVIKFCFALLIISFFVPIYSDDLYKCANGYTKLDKQEHASPTNVQKQSLCYKLFRDHVTGDKANATCAQDNSFLPMMTSEFAKFLHKSNESYFGYWVGLNKYFDEWQWTSWPPQVYEMPIHHGAHANWGMELDNSTFLKGQCGYVNITIGKLQSNDCKFSEIAFPHYCVNYGFSIKEPDNLQRGSDFDVILESNDKLALNITNGDRFPTLNCRVQIYNLIYSDIAEEYFEIAWVKNGLYIPNERNYSLDLNHVRWNGSRKFKANNESHVYAVHRNGIYWCEVSHRGQRPWHVSNMLNVSLSDYDVAILTVEGKLNDQYRTSAAIIETTLLSLVDVIFPAPAQYSALSFSIRDIHPPPLNEIQVFLYFKKYFNQASYDYFMEARRYIIYLNGNRATNNVSIRNIAFNHYYFCQAHNRRIGDVLVYWERIAGGDAAVSSPPCFLQDNSTFARKCIFHSDKGSMWEDIAFDVSCLPIPKVHVNLNDAGYSNDKNVLKGRCEEGFVRIHSEEHREYRDYCISQSMQSPQTYKKALEYCRTKNADLPGPIILGKNFWLDNIENYDNPTWTTLNNREGIFQWDTVFESKFINNQVNLEDDTKYSPKICTTASMTDRVVIQARSCNEKFPFVCIKMVDTLSSNSECPTGWMSNVDGHSTSKCWDGTILYGNTTESLNKSCQSIEAVFQNDITSILPESQLLVASKKMYLNTECGISTGPFLIDTMALPNCELHLKENENLGICVKNRRMKRPGRVVISLDSDFHRLQCKGYNIMSAFGVRWYYNNITLYDNTEHIEMHDRGFKSIFEPKIHQQGYYKCAMWSGDPLTTINSNEILFQLPYAHNDVYQMANNDEHCSQAINNLRQPYRVDKTHIASKNGNLTKVWRAFTTHDGKSPVCNVLLVSMRSIHVTVAGNATMCPAEQGSFLRFWPETRSGWNAVPSEICLFRNGDSVVRRCLGNFWTGAYWERDGYPPCEQQINLETSQLKKLSETTIRDDNINNVTSKLSSLTQNASKIKQIDLHYIASTLENVARSDNLKEENVADAYQTLSHISFADDETLIRSQSQMATSVRILSALSRISQSFNIGEETTMNITTPVASIFKSHDINRGYVYTQQPNSSNISSVNEIVAFNATEDIDDNYVKNSDVVLILPNDLEANEADTQNSVTTLIIYKSNKLFFESIDSNDIWHNVTNYVVSVMIDDQRDTRWFDDPLQIYFQKSNVPSPDKLKCVFMDAKISNGAQWSNLGCIYNGTKYNKIVCLCDHLTDFSAMMEHETIDLLEYHQMNLLVITYVGIMCSNVGLLLIIITYVCYRKWRTGNVHHTIFNLSIAMFISLMEYLFIDKVYGWEIGCIILGASLHYFLLASFCWMVVEGLLQYLRFVKVIGTYIPRFMLKVGIFSWGAPLIPVSVILGIDKDSYINKERKMCWMSNGPLLYGFIVPMALCLLLNFIIFICIIRNLAKCNAALSAARRSRTGRSNRSRLLPKMSELDWRRFIATLGIIFLLGLTWAFGFGVMENYGSHTIVFKYLFTILNSFQGFFIFLLQFLMDSSVKNLWQSKKIVGINPADAQKEHTEDINLSDLHISF